MQETFLRQILAFKIAVFFKVLMFLAVVHLFVEFLDTANTHDTLSTYKLVSYSIQASELLASASASKTILDYFHYFRGLDAYPRLSRF